MLKNEYQAQFDATSLHLRKLPFLLKLLLIFMLLVVVMTQFGILRFDPVSESLKNESDFYSFKFDVTSTWKNPISVVDHNFEARYKYGNIQKQKGIINMHLNIRSLSFKMPEIKK